MDAAAFCVTGVALSAPQGRFAWLAWCFLGLCRGQRKLAFLWWCGGVFAVGVFVAFLWWCGGVFVVVCLWCFCGGVFVVVFLWWCVCGGVFVVVFL